MKMVIPFLLAILSINSSFAQENYTQKIPETEVSFEMIFVKGGNFEMGLPEDHDWYEEQEGKPISVKVAPFWMGKYEVSFDEFTHFQYRNQDTDATSAEKIKYSADAITRPTPPNAISS
ncbi:MAG: SUMF1/EgtB/PvdO family nonheme iron enzyme [Bacteroidota bacterium]